MTKNKFAHAIGVLQSELMDVGGQIFTQEFRFRALQEKAERGDMIAAAQLNSINPSDTIHRLMDLNQPRSELERTFIALAGAIEVLVEAGEEKTLQIESGHLAG